ncbi:DUF1223 domain-containing protein [Phanerochaete sordida]|uniref:DUF1223 domain-containing protein n=1 Tax=Phanerochaete sordida TaxID=48140 RepID=A0A9P3LCF8_9APHY|nr:DUF1223 domain-containing protein [Phanerochaete sordida]
MKSTFNPFRSSGKDKVCVPDNLPAAGSPQPTSIPPPAFTVLPTYKLDILLPPSTPLTIIELFQSQGCSSCPPANANVLRLLGAQDTLSAAQRQTLNGTNTLVLTYDVTYWDYIGWPDTFGDARWDARQREYAAAMGSRSVYTPQVIVNGTASGVGARQSELDALIREGASAPHANSVSVTITSPSSPSPSSTPTEIIISGPATTPALVHLILYDPATHRVAIARGENAGRTLPHRNIVRDAVVLCAWDRGSARFALPEGVAAARARGWEAVVLVQRGRGGAVVGAARV